jgi:hypothetical protein
LKKISRQVLFLALVLGHSFQSHAALLIEPVVGFSFGKGNVEIDAPATPSLNDTINKGSSGASYGGRLGYQNFGLQLGLDYLASNMKFNGEDFKTSEFGGFVGYEFPILFRVYAGYVFSGTGTLSEDAEDYKLKGGTGPKVGVGFTLLPLLDFNIEYRSITYQELDILNGAAKVNMDYNAVMVGFSLPFTL